MERDARVRFDQSVESVRMGSIFASGKAGHKAYERWRRQSPVTAKPVAKTGMALEQHVAQLRRSRPDLVGVRA